MPVVATVQWSRKFAPPGATVRPPRVLQGEGTRLPTCRSRSPRASPSTGAAVVTFVVRLGSIV